MSIKGFLPLAITLPAQANLAESSHVCYIKPHLSPSPDQQPDTTCSIFVLNPLPNWTLQNLNSVVAQVNSACRLKDVLVREAVDKSRISTSGMNYDIHVNLSTLTNPDLGEPLTAEEKLPFGTAVLTFLDRDNFELFLTSLKKIKKQPVWKITDNDTGLAKYNTVESLNIDKLEKAVVSEIAKFTNREEDAANDISNMREMVDEDGFTLVVGSSKKTKADILGSMKKKADLELDEDHVKKENNKEKKDFYRFQIREKKKQEMNQLLTKFKEDQERVKVMRERRKFRPY